MSPRGGASRNVVFEQMAAWVIGVQDLPTTVMANAKLGILDVLAVSLAARTEPVADVLAAITPVEESGAVPTVIGWSGRTNPQAAAFANGTLAHALDFDDSSADLGGHPSAVVWPAALAAAQAVGASGRELLQAYCVGVEVTCALGRALNPAHYDSGWHPTATLGAFGATAAAGRLYGLGEEQLTQALGLCAAFASGIKASFGTMAKPLQVGRAAQNGVASAELLRAGASGAAGAFEGSQGFLETFQRSRADTPVVMPGQGTHDWSLAMPGLIIKRYPCCGSTHSAIEAAATARDQLPRVAEVEECEIRIHPKRVGHVNRPDPRSALDCKFSLQYTVARALLSGTVRLEDFEGAAPDDPETRALMERTSVGVLDADDERPEDRFVGEVRVRTRDIEVVRRVPMASGRVPGQMLPEGAFWAKYDDCCARAISPGTAGELRAAVLQLEELTTVDAVMALCSAEQNRRAVRL